MTLEERILTAIKNGSFLHVSLNKAWNEDVWEAGYRNCDNHNVQYVRDKDPIKALERAISPVRQPRREPLPSPSRPTRKRRPVKRRERDDEDLI